MLAVKTTRAPYRSIIRPMIGDVNVATKPPAAAAPAISVRLQPNSSDSGYMKTEIVRLAAALRAKFAVPAAPRTSHP